MGVRCRALESRNLGFETAHVFMRMAWFHARGGPRMQAFREVADLGREQPVSSP